jgi:uncharacterized protein (TIGR02449 family)
MDAELAQLEHKVEQVLANSQRLAADNRDLQTRLTMLEGENRKLAAKIAAAAERLETLMEQLPQ